MHQKIIVLDFGSQYTQLIAKTVRSFHVLCEILPFSSTLPDLGEVSGIILSGSPASVHDEQAPSVPEWVMHSGIPILGICYGAQWLSKYYGGKVVRFAHREYGRAELNVLSVENPLFKEISIVSQVWMSHGDAIEKVGEGIEVLASTADVPVAAFRLNNQLIFGLQFHPEVHHSLEGRKLLSNFVMDICGCTGDWTPGVFIAESLETLSQTLGKSKVIMGLSGGVDSTVAATLIYRAIGENLHCIFVDNGLLRKNESTEVMQGYARLGLPVTCVDASEIFIESLKGLTDPEAKRKAIGRVFIEVFESVAKKVEGVEWLGQGTIYPDVIESVKVNGPSVTIKSHHNVGGLPEKMNLKVVEPLRFLFKDDVRRVGYALGLPDEFLERHPFPGPGLAIRIPGEVTTDKLALLREADWLFTDALKTNGLYGEVWQAGAILLPVQSVGVMGDERTYEQALALRAVTSVDGMTADWSRLPYPFLSMISNEIINKVRGINRVVYDISSKPPATIEWE